MRWLARALVVVCVLAAAPVVWLFSTIDLPDEPLRPQASVILYADGSTVLARVGITDRTDVPLDRVPVDVRRAVLAAEDRAYYAHSGVSVRGVVRALWANVTGAGGQGGSTITQQYVRNAYLTLDQTVDRKVREMVLAVKLERRDDKDAILSDYLNTIYFGRGAYGIEAASRAYFGVGVDRLTAAQGAVLAAVIKDPTELDPANRPREARDRWRWILRAMAEAGWLDREAPDRLPYPTVLAPGADTAGPAGHVLDRVERDLRGWGVSAQALRTAGLTIVTTLDAGVQRTLVASARAARRELRGRPRAALVAIEPATGAVRGYYGGERGRGFYDDAIAARPPGRLFQPVVLAEALSQDYSLHSTWDGRSPQLFADRGGVFLRNPNGQQCPVCRLDEAFRLGINTALYGATARLGPGRVAQRARLSGISTSYGDGPSLVDVKGEPKPGRTRGDIALGHYPVSVADLTSVYATFEAGGRHRPRRFVTEVRTAGHPLTRPAARVRAAMAPDEAATVVRALAGDPVQVAPPDIAGAGLDKTWRLGLGLVRSERPIAVESAVPRGDVAVAGLWCARYESGLAIVGWLGHDPARALAAANGRPARTATARRLCTLTAGQSLGPAPA